VYTKTGTAKKIFAVPLLKVIFQFSCYLCLCRRQRLHSQGCGISGHISG